jgi:hypothetical protein
VVEQGLSRDHDPEVFEKTRSRFPSKGEADMGEPSVEALGSASVVCRNTRQTLCEDRPVAVNFFTEEPPDVQVKGNGNSLPEQIGQSPRVAGVNPE